MVVIVPGYRRLRPSAAANNNIPRSATSMSNRSTLGISRANASFSSLKTLQSSLVEMRSCFIKECHDRGISSNGDIASVFLRPISTSIDDGSSLTHIVCGQTIGHNVVEAFTSVMNKFFYTDLRVMCFWRCGLHDLGIQAICKALPNLHGLRVLELVDAECTSSIAVPLAASLASVSRSLTRFKFDHNPIDSGALAILCRPISTAARHHLHHLSLSFCELTPDCGQIIGSIVSSDRCTLQMLNLEGNLLGDAGIEPLAKAFAINRSISDINLANNRFGASISSTTSLCHAFRCNSSVRNVDIDGNLIGDQGGLLFLSMIQSCSHIRQFAITTMISPSIFSAILTAVQHHDQQHQTKPRRNRSRAQSRLQIRQEAERQSVIEMFMVSQAARRQMESSSIKMI